MNRGIPTTYKGIRFRSRLEAKWAYFFDALGWNWEYEPLDLNGYIPDFVLNFRDPIIVEVKPLSLWKSNGEQNPIPCELHSKLAKSGWENEVLIVGLSPSIQPLPEDESDPDRRGLVGRLEYPCYKNWWPSAEVNICSECSDGGCSCTITTIDRTCRVCKKIHGAFGSYLGTMPGTWVQRKWAEACNRTQWNGGR